MTHRFVVAEFVLTTQISEVRQTLECLKIVAAQIRYVPEETQTCQSVEPAQVAQSLPGEWTIDQKISGFRAERHEPELRFFNQGRFERGELLQQREAVISDVSSGLEPPQPGLSRQRGDRAIAKVAP